MNLFSRQVNSYLFVRRNFKMVWDRIDRMKSGFEKWKCLNISNVSVIVFVQIKDSLKLTLF